MFCRPAKCQYDQFFGKGIKIPVQLFLSNDILIICDKRPLIEYNEQQAKNKQNQKNEKNKANEQKKIQHKKETKKEDKSKKKGRPRESKFISKLFHKKDHKIMATSSGTVTPNSGLKNISETEKHTSGLAEEDEEQLKREYADFYEMNYFECIHLMNIQNLQFIDNTDDCILIQNFYETFIFSFESETERNSWYDRLTLVRSNLQLLIQRIPDSTYAEINIKKVNERLEKLENQESKYREKIRNKLNDLFSMEDVKIAKLKKQEKQLAKLGLIQKNGKGSMSSTANTNTTNTATGAAGQPNALLADDEDDEIKLREIQEEFLHMIEDYSNFQLKLYHIRARKDELLLYLNNKIFIEGFETLPTYKDSDDLNPMEMTPAAREMLGITEQALANLAIANGMGNQSNLTVESSLNKDLSIDRSHTPPTVTAASGSYTDHGISGGDTLTTQTTQLHNHSRTYHGGGGGSGINSSNEPSRTHTTRTLRGASVNRRGDHSGVTSGAEELSHTNTLQGTLTWRMKSNKDVSELPKGINQEKWKKAQQKFFKKEAKMFANDIKSVEVEADVNINDENTPPYAD